MDAEPWGRPPTAARGLHDRVDDGRLPARALRLVDAACALCDHWLDPTLRLCLDRFDKRLYEQAERSRGHLEQQRCFDSRTLAQKCRASFIQTFAMHLRESFAQMGATKLDVAPPAPDLESLTLLDRTEHELTAALDKLAARCEAHNGPLLSELSYRLAVLAGAAPLEGEDLPPGPHNLTRILRIASEPMNLPIEHRLLLLHVFESSVGNALPSLYQGINAKLLADNILPPLRAFPSARLAHSPAHEPAAATPAPAVASAPAPATERNEPIAVLETLRDLLIRQRIGAAGPAPAPIGHIATQEELQTALSVLQQHMIQVTDQTSRELRSAQRLRDELLLQLNAGRPVSATSLQLSDEQGDTVELVAMLFEQVVKQLHNRTNAKALLGNLQLPLLRMAVADRGFFDRREHPARQLLGKLAETLHDWVEGPAGETDHTLLSKLTHLVERAQHEPPSAGLYTTLLADIEYHLSQLTRKAQATERRHVEAMQGRERLEQARRRADALVAERFAAAPPHGLLRTLLERAWTDVLALYLLRHGEDSDAFRGQLRITDQLLGQLPIDDPAQLRHDVEAGLQQIGMNTSEAEQVAQRLIGTEPPPAAATTAPPKARADDNATPPPAPPAAPAHETAPPAPATSSKPRIAEPIAPPASAPPSRTAGAPSATDLALRLKQHQRLGEQRNQESPHPAPAITDDPPLGLREARIHNHLRQLPFGTWFEFTDPASGECTQRKLAWFSPVSGNSLFVTRRGQRSEVMNLQDLARAIANGRARELPQQQENLLDRAWHALTANLLGPAPAIPS